MILALSILDSVSPALIVPGTVIRHTTGSLDNTYMLTLHLQSPDFPATVSANVSPLAYHDLHDGEHIFVRYSPFLHVLNALDSTGDQGQQAQHYVLPTSGATGMLPGAIALLLLGFVLLPYPAVLARWGCHDMYAERLSHRDRLQVSGTVVALRAATETQMRRPGMLPLRGVRTWYGVAILPTSHTNNVGNSGITTFAIRQGTYQTVKEGTKVTISYSPHLHYVYSLQQTGETGE